MRDLANQEFKSSKPSVKNNAILRILIIAAVIGGVIFLVKTRFVSPTSSGGAVKLQEAPRGLTPVSVDQVNVADSGIDLKTDAVKMKLIKIDDVGAEASASRSYGGGTYILSVDATLPDPKGNGYAVWLISDNGPILIDYMNGSGSSWSLRFKSTDKYSKYDKVWITLERTRDQKPEEHVFEGTF